MCASSPGESAVRAQRRPFVIARTDAAASEGLDGAVRQAGLYLKAGADAVFPEALTNEARFRESAQRVPAPQPANMPELGRTPCFTAAQFEVVGYARLI